MIALVINKMSFNDNNGDTIEGVNLTVENNKGGYYIAKSFSKKGEKLKFFKVPHNVYTSIKVGGIYNFTFKTDSDTGFAVVDGCKPSTFAN